VLTTTNGTRAIIKALRADYVLTAALLNARACAKASLELRRDIVLLCAGSHDEFAIEDGLCAGLLLDSLRSLSSTPIEMDDFGMAMLALYHNRSGAIENTVIGGATGRRLLKLGMRRDIEACSELDLFSVVPKLSGDGLIRS
jgi:2-phosphosulfolactate phosphatase